MPDLTLEQVRKAGRFAVRPPPYPPGIVVSIYVYDPQSSGVLRWSVYDAEWQTRLSGAEGGWHHLPDCDCEYCKEARDD